MYIYIYTIQHAGSVQLGCDAILDTISYFLLVAMLAILLEYLPLPFLLHAGSEAVFYVSSLQLQVRSGGDLRSVGILLAAPPNSGYTMACDYLCPLKN